MKRLPRAVGLCAAAALGVLLGSAPAAAADDKEKENSIQQPGLTTGIAEGFGRTQGFYVATMIDFGFRSTDPSVTKQAVMIPMFFTWATPWTIGGKTQVSFKGVPFVGVSAYAPGFGTTRPYNPYASVWLSWFLGNGFNLSVGEGVQINVPSKLNETLGRDFNAFQQNVALSYVKNNINVTTNAFYTQGRTRDAASQPHTFNMDFTALKRVARKEYGLVGYGMWDLNKPSVGYGEKQRELALGVMYGYLIGNLVQIQARVTTNVYQSNMGGYETRGGIMAVFPLWTPKAPTPKGTKR